MPMRVFESDKPLIHFIPSGVVPAPDKADPFKLLDSLFA
jgi:hypothetical protein